MWGSCVTAFSLCAMPRLNTVRTFLKEVRQKNIDNWGTMVQPEPGFRSLDASGLREHIETDVAE